MGLFAQLSTKFIYKISYLRYEMPLAHVTRTGNISIPKEWREALGIEPNSSVVINRSEHKIIIEPLRKEKFQTILKGLDEEISRKKISFSKEEALKDDFYD